MHKDDIVIAAIRKQLESPDQTVEMSTRLDELDLDSLKFMLLMIELQDDEKKLSVDVKNIGSVKTVRDLTEIVTYA